MSSRTEYNDKQRRDLVQFAQYAGFTVRLMVPHKEGWDMVLAKYNNLRGTERLWNRVVADEAEVQEWINVIEKELATSPV